MPEAGSRQGKCAAKKAQPPAKDPDAVYDLISLDGQKQYDARDLLASIIDADSLDEYKADYGKTLVTAYARIGGHSVGIVANQRHQVRTKKAGIQMGGVIYSDSADKAARFVMDCNQTGLPIIFFQDVTGFMVGRDAEQSGIIRSGAKLVNAVSNSIVPKITVVVGGSFGAGNYALCGKAYDPRFILAWPNARYAVMGAAQASDTVFSVLARSRERGDRKATPEELEQLRAKVKETYEEQTDIRYGAARGWVDAIIQPHETRDVLVRLLGYVARPMPQAAFPHGCGADLAPRSQDRSGTQERDQMSGGHVGRRPLQRSEVRKRNRPTTRAPEQFPQTVIAQEWHNAGNGADSASGQKLNWRIPG